MRRLTSGQWKPGVIVAEAVHNSWGNVILQKGTELTAPYIERLKKLGISEIVAEEEGAQAAAHETSGQDGLSGEGSLPIDVYLKQWMEGVLHYQLSAELDKRFPELFHTIMREILSKPQIVKEVGRLRAYDRYLFEHSLQVALYAGMLGTAVGYDHDRLLELTVGALLFDVGMMQLPQSMIKKEGVLTQHERQLLTTHTIEGFHNLLAMEGVTVISARCALMHHERYDGKGYPFGLKGEEILEQAQIISICDVYDALRSPRHHRNAFTENEALEFLFASGHTFFHTDLVKLFLRYVACYPVSSTVRLNNGQVGLVTSSDAGLPHRPVIRIIKEADGTPVLQPYEVNLLDKPELTIIQSLKEG